jgi:Ca-activated chloride channel family protein
MHFAQPLWIVIGIFVCIAVSLLLQRYDRQRQIDLARFAAPHLLGRLTRHISQPRRHLKRILFILSILLSFIAIARPQYGSTWIEVQRKGIDILFALDTSRSMLAQDIKPNRLERARYAIMDFVGRLDGDRAGLLPFAGSAFLLCPMTLDYNAFSQSLAEIDTNSIPLGGTDLSAVIREAERVFAATGNHKILILVTDGENLQGEALAAAKEAGAKGLTIYTVGVGTQAGELIPAGNETTAGFLKNSDGSFVTSRLDEKTLREIAEATGGIYVPLGDQGQGLDTLYQKKLDLIPKEQLSERRQKMPIERYAWPLALALLCLLVEFLLVERKKDFKLPSIFRKILRRGPSLGATALLVGLSGSLFFSGTSEAAMSKGEEYFTTGDYLKASEYYDKALARQPDDPTLNYNYGAAAYKNHIYDEALAAFSKALKKTDDLELQHKSYYNMANANYQKGMETIKTNPRATIEQWQQALDSYSAALKLQADDSRARHNFDVVEKKLQELKKQQQEKEQENSDQRDKEKKKEQQPDQQAQQNKQNQEKQGQEQQQDGKQQQTSASTNPGQSSDQHKDAKPESGAPQKEPQSNEGSGKGGKEEQQSQAATGQDRPPTGDAGDAARRLQGKLTRDEAERLLDAMQAEEKSLPFPPSEHNDQPEKNW